MGATQSYLDAIAQQWNDSSVSNEKLISFAGKLKAAVTSWSELKKSLRIKGAEDVLSKSRTAAGWAGVPSATTPEAKVKKEAKAKPTEVPTSESATEAPVAKVKKKKKKDKAAVEEDAAMFATFAFSGAESVNFTGSNLDQILGKVIKEAARLRWNKIVIKDNGQTIGFNDIVNGGSYTVSRQVEAG